MRKIIETLKKQREEAEKAFIKNSLIKRSVSINSPVPDTEAYLDDICSLNQAIGILENYGARKAANPH